MADTQTDGLPVVIAIGFDAPRLAELVSATEGLVTLVAESVAEFRATAGSAPLSAAIGCFLHAPELGSTLLQDVGRRLELWLMQGTGLAVGGGAEPLAANTAAALAELGADVLPPDASVDAMKEICRRWVKLAGRRAKLGAPLLQQTEAAFASADYQEARRLIDSLTLIDPRKRQYLALLAVRMLEEKTPKQAEECLRRALIHWPSQASALALLVRLLGDDGRTDEAARFGGTLVKTYGLSLLPTLTGGGWSEAAAGGESPLPVTTRLLKTLYGPDGVFAWAKTHLAVLTRAKADTTVFQAILAQTADERLKGLVTQAAPAAKLSAPAKNPPAPPAAVETLPALAAPVPQRAHTNTQLLELLTAARQSEPDFVLTKTFDIVYRKRVLVFHPEAGGHKRITKVLSDIGCQAVEGHDDPATVADRMRSVRVDGIVLWYQEDQDRALEVLADIAGNRHLPRFFVWVLTPSQAAQIKFASAAQHVFFDGNDVVRWQKGQFEDDFKRLLAKAETPSAAGNILAALRRPWREPFSPPLTEAQIRDVIAKAPDTLTTEPGRAYWLRAGEALHAAERGDWSQALSAAAKLAGSFPSLADARLVVAAAKRGSAGVEVAAGELVEHRLKSKTAFPERDLQLAYLLARWGAAKALARLADGIGSSRQPWGDAKHAHRLDVIAGLYYRLTGRLKEAQAHLARACEQAPLRADYVAELAGVFGPKDASFAADLWELAAQSDVLPVWYCYFRAGEVLLQGGKAARAGNLFERCAKENPSFKPAQELLAEARRQAA